MTVEVRTGSFEVLDFSFFLSYVCCTCHGKLTKHHPTSKEQDLVCTTPKWGCLCFCECVSVAKLVCFSQKRCRVRYSFTVLKEELLLSKAEKELDPEVPKTLNLGVACHQYAQFSSTCRGQMQKRTSEMDFSANFESIHVVSDFFIEIILPCD